MKEIYLDNAATTKVLDQSVNQIVRMMTQDYYNSSSLHHGGYNVKQEVEIAKKYIANYINCNPQDIFFTSGGTESNNLAIQGYILGNKSCGKHIITTVYEHPSVLSVFNKLSTMGFKVDVIDAKIDGSLNINKLFDLINDDTSLISITHANSELGNLNDIKKIVNKIKSIKSNIIVHVDASQSFMKEKIDVKDMKIDLLTITPHKFHGPKGIGILYKRSTLVLSQLFYGGGQQNELRSGTINSALIMGTYEAIKTLNNNEYKAHLISLKNRFLDNIRVVEEIKLNTDINNSLPNILSFYVKDMKSQVLINALSDKGIYISAGSACKSNKKQERNLVLEAMGRTQEEIQGTIRISFGIYNTIEQVDYACKCIVDTCNELWDAMGVKA